MENDREGIMLKIARFVVNKRKAFVVLFALACVYSALSVSKVEVINELTDYLAEDSETRQGLNIMEEEFVTFGSARILVSNITYERALALADEMEAVEGISAVSFYRTDDEAYKDADMSDSYRDACALYDLTFEEEEDTELSQAAIAEVRRTLEGYDAYVYTTVDKDDAASLRNDMKGIVVVVIAVIIGVLLFTSKTYMEIVIFLIVFGVAAILNMGTNYWFGSVSFVTNAVGAVLQLALAIDYAIILFHRFMEEKEDKNTIDAMTVALSKAIPEISSSSLTTIAGMVALMFMKFGIGMDLGRVLAKAILFSLLTVFLLMPALIVMFADLIEKTAHRSFVPSIRGWGRLVVRVRYVTMPLFLVVVAAACVFAQRCPYIYDANSIDTDKKNEYLTSKERIEETFQVTSAMAVLVPRGDYGKEAEILRELENIEEVDSALGLANVEVTDDGKYILVDKLNPREFSEVADVDMDLVRLLYQFYAAENGQYSAFMKNLDDYRVSIIDMVDFIYQQKENGGIDFGEEKSEEIDDLYTQICDARKQLEGEHYDRLVFNLKGPVEGEETFAVIDRIHQIAARYYDEDEVYVVGDATNNYDLSSSFQTDNLVISVLTALLVGIILLFTFQSAGLPFLLVLTIQGSIWINFSIPYLRGTTMFFLSYLIVSAIQMGATIDYAIVITSRYLELRKTMPDRKQAVVEALNQAFPTIITSGTMLVCAGFAVGNMTYNGTIASLGKALGTGTIISIVMVMTVLPQCLLVFDKWIDRTELTRAEKKRPEKGRTEEKESSRGGSGHGESSREESGQEESSRGGSGQGGNAPSGSAGKSALCLAAVLLLSCSCPLSGYAAEAGAQADGVASESAAADGAETENSYPIENVEDFLEFAENCVSEEFSAGKTFVLKNDIDLSRWENTRVPVFAGHFQGGGHAVTGIKINAAGSDTGLFRYVVEGGEIEDLQVRGTVEPGGSGTNVGGIAGSNRGTIRRCGFDGSVTGQEAVGGIAGFNGEEGLILECRNEAEVTACRKTGGITGHNEGSVQDCRNSGAVNPAVRDSGNTADSDSQMTGNVDLEEVLEQEKINDTGGIAGFSTGSISGCVNEGTIGCPHTGYNTGGIVGRQSGIVSGCVNEGEIRGRKDTGGIAGQLEPHLSVTYEDTLDTLRDQLDDLGQMTDGLSEILEEGGDAAESNLDQIGDRVDDIRDVGDFYKEILQSDKDSFTDDLDGDIDSIEEGLNNLDLDLFPRSSKDAAEELDRLADREKELRAELEQGYQGPDDDPDAFREWLKREQEILEEMGANAQKMEQLTAQILREVPGYAMEGAEEFIDQLEDLSLDIQDLIGGIQSNLNLIDGDLEILDGAMAEQMDLLSGEVDSLTGDIKDSGDRLRQQKQLIEDQLDRISDTVSDGLDQAEEQDGELFEDVSDNAGDGQEVTEGTLLECENRGAVSTDHQGGGIAGMIGLEAGQDPEQDLNVDEERTLSMSGSANALVRGCVNRGEVLVKYDCAGGIAGKTNLGALTDNRNYGDVMAEGQYAGGIAGSSSYVLRRNYSMSAVAGKDYAGGIAGWACDLYENGVMAELSGASGEWIGSVAGAMDEEGTAENNYYVDQGLGAVDGVTRAGQAKGLSYEEFLAMEQTPEEFGRLTVTFLADDQVLAVVPCRYGDGILADQIPELPGKEGFYGQWEDTDLTCIRNSRKVRAVYRPWVSTIASSDDKMPLLLAEADFYPGTRIEVEESSAEDGTAAGTEAEGASAEETEQGIEAEAATGAGAETEGASEAGTEVPAGYRLVSRYSYRVLTPEGQVFDGPVRLHILANGKRKDYAAALVKDGSAQLTDSKTDGSYLVLNADSRGEVLLLEKQSPAAKWLRLILPAAVLLAAALILYRKRDSH